MRERRLLSPHEPLDPPSGDESASTEEKSPIPLPSIERPPKRAKPARAANASTEAQWTSTDYLVALLAIAVLITSILGLFWIASGP